MSKKPKKIIVDVDSTLMDHFDDKAWENAIEKIRKAKRDGKDIVVLTGRYVGYGYLPKISCIETVDVLDDSGFPFEWDEDGEASNIICRELGERYYDFKRKFIKKLCNPEKCTVIDNKEKVIKIAEELGHKGILIKDKKDWDKLNL